MADVGTGTALHIGSVAVAESLSGVERQPFTATLYRLNLAYTLRFWRVATFNVRTAAGSSARDVAVMADIGGHTALHTGSVAVGESLSGVEREPFPETLYCRNLVYMLRPICEIAHFTK